MSEQQFKVGDRVRHKSDKKSPPMVIVEIRKELNKLGDIHCTYWHNDEFKTKTFIVQELVRLADIQP
jgi:uncharacterized protein YodC (DUF2158 family)